MRTTERSVTSDVDKGRVDDGDTGIRREKCTSITEGTGISKEAGDGGNVRAQGEERAALKVAAVEEGRAFEEEPGAGLDREEPGGALSNESAHPRGRGSRAGRERGGGAGRRVAADAQDPPWCDDQARGENNVCSEDNRGNRGICDSGAEGGCGRNRDGQQLLLHCGQLRRRRWRLLSLCREMDARVVQLEG